VTSAFAGMLEPIDHSELSTTLRIFERLVQRKQQLIASCPYTFNDNAAVLAFASVALEIPSKYNGNMD
jgi:hypothetical protein